MSEAHSAPPPLTEPEADLAKLAASQRFDGYLLGLAGLADAGAGIPIGILVGSTIIIGTIASERKMAEALDDLIVAVLANADDDADQRDDDTEAESQADGNAAFSMYVDAAQARRDAKVRTRERYEAEFGDAKFDFAAMPRDLAREIIHESDTMLTLTSAKVVRAGADAPIELSVMRINMHQITGWWTLPLDSETGRASFSIPR
jgi:hypothetical protein